MHHTGIFSHLRSYKVYPASHHASLLNVQRCLTWLSPVNPSPGWMTWVTSTVSYKRWFLTISHLCSLSSDYLQVYQSLSSIGHSHANTTFQIIAIRQTQAFLLLCSARLVLINLTQGLISFSSSPNKLVNNKTSRKKYYLKLPETVLSKPVLFDDHKHQNNSFNNNTTYADILLFNVSISSQGLYNTDLHNSMKI